MCVNINSTNPHIHTHTHHWAVMRTRDGHPWELVAPLCSGQKEVVFSILGFLLALDVFLRFSPVFLAVYRGRGRDGGRGMNAHRGGLQGLLNESQPDGTE